MLQEYVKNTDLPELNLLELKDMIFWGKGLWKVNNSLTSNAKYAEKMENHIFGTLYMFD